MNRRSFTELLVSAAQKELSKLSDKVKPVSYGKTEFFKSEKDMIERITGQPKDPYEDVAEHIYKEYWKRKS